MDRFIGKLITDVIVPNGCLKSNMDRFIAEKCGKKYPLGVI